jgi:hypothetical protein
MTKLQITRIITASAFLATPNLQAKCLEDETDLIYYGYRYYKHDNKICRSENL